MILAAAFVAVLATSCSQDETIAISENAVGNSMTFRAFTGQTTRATEVTGSNFRGFHLHAFQEPKTSGSLANATQVWENDFTSQNGSSWTCGTTYYWPSTQMHFFGYSFGTNNSGTTSKTVSMDGATKQITNVTPNATPATQEDLLVAYQRATYNQTNGQSQAVELNFKHVLSQVKVTGQNNGSLRVRVIGVRLNGLNSVSTFSYPNNPTGNNSNTLALSSSWNPADNNANGNKEGDYRVTFGSASSYVELTNSPLSLMDVSGNANNSFMVLPQALTQWDPSQNETTANGAYISVLCQISQNTGSAEQPNWIQLFPDATANSDHAGKFAWSAVPINTTLNPGYCYTFNLNFTNGGGTTDPEQPDPGTDPEVPVDPNKPVLGGTMTFTVNVSEWVPFDGNSSEDGNHSVDTPM